MPGSPDLAEAHRAHLTRWCYDCPPAMHRGLGELYVTDARFTKTIDRHRSGLAAYLRDAILANAARVERIDEPPDAAEAVGGMRRDH